MTTGWWSDHWYADWGQPQPVGPGQRPDGRDLESLDGVRAPVTYPPAPLLTSQAPQGSWVGAFGSDGYALGAWDGVADLVSIPGATVTVESGLRFRWSAGTSDVRALQAPDGSSRRASAWYSSAQVQTRLDFAGGYAGMLRLYAVDWDNGGRSQTIEVSGGTSTWSVHLSNFADGVWVEVPIGVQAGASVTIRAIRTGGQNAVISGIFLGGATQQVGPGVPPSDLATLTREGAQVVSRCEVHRPGDRVDTVPIVDGSVTYEGTAFTRRSVNMSLLGPVPSRSGDLLAPAGTSFHVFRGARDWSGQVVEEPVGVYVTDESGIDRSGRLVSINGADAASLVVDNRWEAATEYSGPLATVIQAALRSRLPTWMATTLNAASTSMTVPPTVFGEEVDNDPWDDLTKLAEAAGMRLRFSRSGTPTLDPVPDPDVAPVVWDYTAGAEPTYLDGAKQLYGRPYNVIVATYEPVGGGVRAVNTVVDDDPDSGSYVGFYRNPFFITNGLMVTQAQRIQAARAALNARKGLAEVVTIQSVPHPAFDVGQVVRAFDPEIGVDARYVIERMTLPLRPGRMTLTTRRRRL